MEQQVDRLVEKAWEKFQKLQPSQRLLIGVAGIPGSGKSTLAAKVTSSLNDRYTQTFPALAQGTTTPFCTFIPMDGYHLTRAQLSAMPDPVHAHARRGASFTFDGAGFLALVKTLRSPLTPETSTVYAASFDHSVGDPVADDIPIAASARVVVLEGLYVALDEGAWREARELMDEVWFVEVGEKTARKRLVKRHVLAGLAKDEVEAGRRADENDLVNGRQIMKMRAPVDEVIKSVEDEDWKAEMLGLEEAGNGDSGLQMLGGVRNGNGHWKPEKRGLEGGNGHSHVETQGPGTLRNGH